MVTIQDRALRILMEQDLRSVGESDSFLHEGKRYTIANVEKGWELKIECNPDAEVHAVSTHVYPSASRLFRSLFTFLNLQW